MGQSTLACSYSRSLVRGLEFECELSASYGDREVLLTTFITLNLLQNQNGKHWIIDTLKD